MPKLDSVSAQKFGYDNMRGNAIKNIGKPRQSTDAMTFGMPVYTTTERNALNTTLIGNALIFNSTTNKLNFWDSSTWREVTSS